MRPSLRSALVGLLLIATAGLAGPSISGCGSDLDAKAEAVMAKNPAEWDDGASPVPVSSKDPIWGSRSAPVTIVLYSDFQCPYCQKVEASLDEVKQKYGPEKLRIVWKNNPLPIHKDAKPAALAAATVFDLGGAKAFWRFHEKAFENQKGLTEEAFASWADGAGVDRAAYQAAYAEKKLAAKVEDDFASGKKIGVRGTPASFINGVYLNGAQPASEFSKVIDAELAKADKLAASGVAADQLYVKLSQENVAKTPLVKDTVDKRIADQPLTNEQTVWKVPVGVSPVRGPADALVTIVEFAEFECAFSLKAAPVLADLMKAHPGKLRIVWKHRPAPFHARAVPAAMLSVLARREKGDEGFWAAHDALFADGRSLEDDGLVAIGKKIGLDEAQVKLAIAQPAGAALDDDAALADDLEASGTPHLFINGRRIVGAPAPKVRAVVEEELKKAEDLVVAGTPAAEVYAKVMASAKEMPPPETKTIDPAPEDAPTKGNPAAKIEMHMFSDFECPFCKRSEGTLAQVEKDYGDRVKFIWRDKPLSMHKTAPLAAQAAREAYKQKGVAGFWAFHDELFKIQGADFGRSGFDEIAEKQGLDLKAFGAALDSGAHAAAVQASSDQAGGYGITGAPSFVVTFAAHDGKLDGYFMSGAAPYAKFKRIIRAAMERVDGPSRPRERDDLPPPPPEPAPEPAASGSASAAASAGPAPSASAAPSSRPAASAAPR
jgi:protein-disulfide isomerase